MVIVEEGPRRRQDQVQAVGNEETFTWPPEVQPLQSDLQRIRYVILGRLKRPWYPGCQVLLRTEGTTP